MFCRAVKMHTLMYCAVTRWLVSPAGRALPGALPCGQHLCMAAKRRCPGRKASVAQSKPSCTGLTLSGSVQATQLISSVTFDMVKNPAGRSAPRGQVRSGGRTAPQSYTCARPGLGLQAPRLASVSVCARERRHYPVLCLLASHAK